MIIILVIKMITLILWHEPLQPFVEYERKKKERSCTGVGSYFNYLII